MGKFFLYAGVAALTFIGFLIVYAPASLAWSLIKADVDRAVPDLEVLGVDGSVWSGNAALRYREFPPANLTWSLRPTSLPEGPGARIDLTLEGEGLRAAGTGNTTRTFASVDAAGVIDSSYINPVSVRYGLTFPGEVNIQKLRLRSDLTWFQSAVGTATWGGGTVLVESAAGAQAFTLPALDGTLSMNGSNLILDVTSAGQILLQVTLKPTGWAVVDIKARLLEEAGLPFRAGTSPNASAIIAEEKLF